MRATRPARRRTFFASYARHYITALGLRPDAIFVLPRLSRSTAPGLLSWILRASGRFAPKHFYCFGRLIGSRTNRGPCTPNNCGVDLFEGFGQLLRSDFVDARVDCFRWPV